VILKIVELVGQTKKMIQQFIDFVKSQRLFDSSSRILLAVSGGADLDGDVRFCLCERISFCGCPL
jgi:DNA gyrase inhibitor GyrI